jgi:hypothetical protein
MLSGHLFENVGKTCDLGITLDSNQNFTYTLKNEIACGTQKFGLINNISNATDQIACDMKKQNCQHLSKKKNSSDTYSSYIKLLLTVFADSRICPHYNPKIKACFKGGWCKLQHVPKVQGKILILTISAVQTQILKIINRVFERKNSLKSIMNTMKILKKSRISRVETYTGYGSNVCRKNVFDLNPKFKA